MYWLGALGNSRISDASGNPVRSLWYDPWGAVVIDSGGQSVRYKYTGQEQDNTWFYDYHARLYDPALGRFLSADTMVPQPGNPQSLNRYAYAYNNPLKFIDPSGHCGTTPWGAQLCATGQTLSLNVSPVDPAILSPSPSTAAIQRPGPLSQPVGNPDDGVLLFYLTSQGYLDQVGGVGAFGKRHVGPTATFVGSYYQRGYYTGRGRWVSGLSLLRKAGPAWWNLPYEERPQ